MAEFNKAEIADMPVMDQTRNSQGFRGDTSLGVLAETAGNVVKGATDLTYNVIDSVIETKLRASVDDTQNEFGVGAATEAKTGLANPNPVPEGIDRAMEHLKILRSGYMTNKLRESNYRAQLELTSRQLRMRFPGFREEIDNKIARMTGSVPANALVSTLKQEAEEDLAELRRKSGDEDSESKRFDRMWDKALW